MPGDSQQFSHASSCPFYPFVLQYVKEFRRRGFHTRAAKSSDIPNLITKGTFNEKDLYKSHGKHEFF